MTEIQIKILAALYHGSMCLPEIAEQIDVPTFTVNAELKALKRRRLVGDGFERTAHVWKLTTAGSLLVADARQEKLA